MCEFPAQRDFSEWISMTLDMDWPKAEPPPAEVPPANPKMPVDFMPPTMKTKTYGPRRAPGDLEVIRLVKARSAAAGSGQVGVGPLPGSAPPPEPRYPPQRLTRSPMETASPSSCAAEPIAAMPSRTLAQCLHQVGASPKCSPGHWRYTSGGVSAE